MKCVFEASTGLEAHMILNLLQQEGINARINGEFLQGGVGELQAINIVRVLVDEPDYNKARSIIEEWESTQINDADAHSPAKKGFGFGSGIVFGLIIGASIVFFAYISPITSDGIDYNGDGKLDEKWTYRDNNLYRVAIDRNLDGNMDIIHNYNLKGIISKSRADDNFDGIYETKYQYRRGNIYLQVSDLNQDGHIDYRARYNNGVLSEVGILGPEPRSPKKKQIFHMNKLVSAEYDLNGDGVYDISYEYDFYEEVARKKSNNKSTETR